MKNLTNTLIIPLAMMMFTFGVGFPQKAQAEIEYGGSLRLRYEDKIDFNFAESEQDYILSQLRLNMNWKPNERSRLFVELQDSRIFNEDQNDFPAINDKARNQPFADELDVHQFYYQHKWGGGQITLGRQKLNLADMRLVASLEWVNTARVHDGIRFTLGDPKRRQVDIFASRLVSVDPGDFNDQGHSGSRYFDSEFHGALVTDKVSMQDNELQYWYFFRRNDHLDDSIHTIGGRYLTEINQWNIEVQGAYQSGTFGGLDHTAFMFHGGVESDALEGKLGIAYNYASGDNNSLDGKHKTFDNLYPLNHAYYGYMDFFSLQNIHNLEIVYRKPIYEKTKFRFAYQNFWLADTKDAWYNAGLAGNSGRLTVAQNSDDGVDRYMGSEIDITLNYPVSNKWGWTVGYSHFFAAGYIDDTGSDNDADFFFLMTKVTF